MSEYRVQVKQLVGPSDLVEISDLLALARISAHQEPMSEQGVLDLHRAGSEDSDGFFGVLAHEVDDADLVGFAQLSSERGTWSLEIVVHPTHRRTQERLSGTLLEAAVDVVRHAGGGRLRYWIPYSTHGQDATASALGFSLERELRQLRVSLPLATEVRGSTDLVVRPFVIGADEQAWLDLNNRAFAEHPEQGGWTLFDVRERESQEWFDASGFLLHEVGGRLRGSCWTKIHRGESNEDRSERGIGEIYVIGVDPEFQGHGLGRALTVQGLTHLSSVGITEAMLYVEADNVAAVGLYGSLGFRLGHVDRAFLLDVAGS